MSINILQSFYKSWTEPSVNLQVAELKKYQNVWWCPNDNSCKCTSHWNKKAMSVFSDCLLCLQASQTRSCQSATKLYTHIQCTTDSSSLLKNRSESNLERNVRNVVCKQMPEISVYFCHVLYADGFLLHYSHICTSMSSFICPGAC